MPSLQAQAQAIADTYTPPITGRPSDIGDAALLQELFTAIADGNYPETACHLIGLAPATFYNWKKRGEAGETPYDRFVESVKRAEARAEAKMLANVRKASELPQFWAAGMTVLERRHPERWGKRQDETNAPKVLVQVGGGGQVQVNIGVGVGPSPSLSEDLHSLSASGDSDQSPIKNNYVNEVAAPIESVPVPASQPAISIPAQAFSGDPTPAGGASVAKRRNLLGKGRSAVGRTRKKKGPAGR